MGVTVARASNPEQEIANANYKQIRLFKVKLTVADQPLDDVQGSWQFCDPEGVRNFSAVGYFFSRELHKARSVPVGFIESDWGGTPGEAWTSRPAMEAEPMLKSVFTDWDHVLANYPAAKERYEKQLEAWKAEGKPDTARPREPAGPGHQNTPAGLYNAMIAPITPYAMRGVLWYQGENNAKGERAFLYRRLLQTLIQDWRRAWGEGQFPFLVVQLANYETGPQSLWPVLRESQVKALDLAATGLAVTIDIGESGDIHPKNKQEVGRRLALAARGIAYKETFGIFRPAIPADFERGQPASRLVRSCRLRARCQIGRRAYGLHHRRRGSPLCARPGAGRWREPGREQPRRERSCGRAVCVGGRSGCEPRQ